MFMSVRNVRLNAIHSVIKKMFHKRSSCCQCRGLSETAYFDVGYFSTKLGTWQNNIEIAQEINGREPILSKICIYTANVQVQSCKRDFTIHFFLFRQNMCRNLKFLTAEKIRHKKNFFAIGRVVFCSRYPNICDRTKRMDHCSARDMSLFSSLAILWTIVSRFISSLQNKTTVVFLLSLFVSSCTVHVFGLLFICESMGMLVETAHKVHLYHIILVLHAHLHIYVFSSFRLKNIQK
jgi:hypothetical protein